MARLDRFWPVILIGILAFGGCLADTNPLESLQCDNDSECGEGKSCVDGFCLVDNTLEPEPDPEPTPIIDTDEDNVPDEEDNCPNDANEDQLDNEGDGLGDICDDDDDNDTVLDDEDNCPTDANEDQLNSDGVLEDGGDACDDDDDDDTVLDGDDNCPTDANTNQVDLDQDGTGDACDTDRDGDGVRNQIDNCPFDANEDQLNSDGVLEDGGDVCDEDDDNDTVLDGDDNCSVDANLDQADFDRDGVGDACDDDIDGDNVTNEEDNCPLISNEDQLDNEGDGLGDICDDDDDNDTVLDDEDNCPTDANEDQLNSDNANDGGDACDDDDDNDFVLDGDDNCPTISNLDQANTDQANDGGDVCDDDDDNDTVPDDDDNCPFDANEDQLNSDNANDGGNACDENDDDDDVADFADNCPTVVNNDQLDDDEDGEGDACDTDDDNDGVLDDVDLCPFAEDVTNNDGDEDGIGDVCDVCPGVADSDQVDTDGDGQGDLCDPCPSPRLHVAQNALEHGTGSTWETPLAELTEALTKAETCLDVDVVEEIWVAGGVYFPGDNPEDSFALVDGVELIGGFQIGQTLREERDIEQNPTILSGDIGGDDIDSNDDGLIEFYRDILGDNSDHLVTASGLGSGRLDGFIITGGQSGGEDNNGGGIQINNSTITLANLRVQGNSTAQEFGQEIQGGGGGLYASASAVSLEDVQFIGNGGALGGAVHLANNSTVEVFNGVFDSNQGVRGGAFYQELGTLRVNDTICASSLTALGGGCYWNEIINDASGDSNWTNVRFIGNSDGSGGFGKGGAMTFFGGSHSLLNTEFRGNFSSSEGGALFFQEVLVFSIFNATFSGNKARRGGAIIDGNTEASSFVTITNAVFWNNLNTDDPNSNPLALPSGTEPSISFSIIEDAVDQNGNLLGGFGNDAGNNLSEDPLFVQDLDPSTAPSTNGDFHLQEGSPALNVGSDLVNISNTDADGLPRFNGQIDLGAFERQP